jgi:vacuolar-type H+-ATPase subunit E/Vma4
MTELRGNLEELVAQVRRRAEARALATESAAEVQAGQVEADGATRIEAARRQAREECAARTAVQRRSQLARADAARRQRRLEAREARLERVFRAAQTELERLAAGPAGDAARAALCRDAARRLGAPKALVTLDRAALARLSAADVAAWADPSGPALELTPEPLASGHGALLRAGRVSIDATFEGRLAQAREVLRGTVATLLTDGPAAAEAPPPMGTP